MMDMPPGTVIAKGRTAEVRVWEEDKVLKLFYDWVPDRWVDQEAKIAEMVVEVGLPAPKMLGTITVEERLGLLYERVEGLSMLKTMSARPWQVTKMGQLLAELQTKIHQCSGEGFPSLKGYLERAIENYQELPPSLKDHILRHLEKLPHGGRICHFDFHPDQVILTESGPVIIDWMTANCGFPAADVARTSLLSTIATIPNSNPIQVAVINRVRSQFQRAYLNHYLALNPDVTVKEINAWMLPVAAARLDEKIGDEREKLLTIISKAVRS